MLMLLYGHSGDVDSAAWPSAWLLQLTESEVSKEGSESKVLVDIGLLLWPLSSEVTSPDTMVCAILAFLNESASSKAC